MPDASVIKDAIYRVKSSIIVVTPVVEPEILQVISQYAFVKKAVRFLLTSHWDLNQYKPVETANYLSIHIFEACDNFFKILIISKSFIQCHI